MTIANSIVISDNAFGTLGIAHSTSDTTLTFTTGHGARFPTVASGQVLSCCILNSNNVLEEVQVTLHTAGADTATMVRAANGSTAKAWSAGDRIEARISSDVLKRLQQEALKEIVITTADAGATYTGSISPTGYGLVTGLVYLLTLTTSNSGTAPTINLSGLGAVTVVLNGSAALVAAQMPVSGLYKYDGTNLVLLNPLDAPFLDTHAIVKGSGDSTKKVRLEVDGLTTATTRVLTVRDADFDLGAATQAEQETGTSLVASVTPGRQQFHPSAAKAWASFNGTGTPALNASYNITSITDGGVGNWTLNFTTNFSSALYAVVTSMINASALIEFSMFSTKTASGVLIRSFTATAAGDTNKLTFDSSGMDVACYGDQ